VAGTVLASPETKIPRPVSSSTKAEILAEFDDVILKSQRCLKLNCELKKDV